MERYLSDLNRFETGTEQATSKVKKSTGTMRQAWAELRGEFPLLDKAARLATNPIVLLGAAVAGTIGIFSKGVAAAREFNHEFLELQNLNLDKTAQQMAGLKQSIFNVAATGLQSANDISKAFFDVQSGTGLFGQEVEAVVQKVAAFSTATKADFDAATQQAVKGMRAWGLEVQQLDGFLASSYATVQVGITTFAQLADVQVEFAGAASAAGQSVDTANKVFAAFTQTAKNTQIAATLTKAAFQDLTKANTVAGFKKIGVEVFDANGRMRDAGEIITDLVAKFKGLSDQDLAELKEEIGGSEGLRGLLDTVKNQGDDLLDTFKAFDSAKGAFDIDALLENAKGDFETLSKIVGNQVNTVFIQLGEAILPIIARVLDSISGLLPDIISGFQNWGGVIQAVTIAFGAMAAIMLTVKAYTIAVTIATSAYTAVMGGIPAIMAAVRSASITLQAAYIALTGGIKGATGAVRAFAIVIRANPVGAFVVGVVALTAAVGFLISRMKDNNSQAERLKKLSAELADRVGKETGQVNRLFAALKDENTSKEEKKKLVDLLLNQYGKYLGNLANEKDLLNNIEEAQKRVNDAIEQKVIAQLKAEKQEDLFAQRTTRRLKLLGDIAAVRPEEQVPLSQDVFADLLTRRADLLRQFKDGVEGAGDALRDLDAEITQTFKTAQDNAGQNISFSRTSGLIREASQDIVDIDRQLLAIDGDFAALGAKSVPVFTDAMNGAGDAMRYAGIAAEHFAKNSIKGVSKELEGLRKQFEAEAFGTVRWYHLAGAVQEAETRLEMMKLAAEGLEEVQRRHLPETAADFDEQLKSLGRAQAGLEKYSAEWWEVDRAITALQEKQKQFAEADAVVLGEAFSIPRREAEGLQEAIAALGADAPANLLALYAVAQQFGDGTAQSLTYVERKLLDFQIRMVEIAEELKSTLTQAFGEAFYAFGKAVGEGEKLGDAFKIALIGLGQVVLSEVPKYLGLFFLETAVGLGFPAGIPFALAGIGLLAFSGLAAGLLSRLGGAQAGENDVAGTTQPQVAAPQQQAAQGLSSYNANEVANIGVKVYIGNEDVTRWMRVNAERELQLTGG